MKNEIIRKSLILIGASNGIIQTGAGSKLSKAESLCEEFVVSAIEEISLAVKWPFALKRVENIENNLAGFNQIQNITDCLKVAVIAPSNIEWYVEAGSIFFKGRRIDSLLYHSKSKLEQLLNNEANLVRQVPESFKLLASLLLVSQISFAMYSDSIFADGLKKQYLIKLNDTKNLYAIDYNLVNSSQM